MSSVFDCETVMKYWSLNNVGFLICDKPLEIKKRGLSEGRDKPKDILLILSFVLPNSFSKAGKYFSIVQDTERVKSSDVDFINLNSGTGCAVMLKTSCVSVLNPWSLSKAIWLMSYMYLITSWKWNCHFTNGLKSYKIDMICVLLFPWTFALVLTSLVWRVLALKLGNKNINARWKFSWCFSVTAIFADRSAGRILQVQVHGLLIFDTRWLNIPAPLNFILQ